METYWLSSKKFLTQRSVKKVMLTVFWDMRRAISIDFLGKEMNSKIANSLAKKILNEPHQVFLKRIEIEIIFIKIVMINVRNVIFL